VNPEIDPPSVHDGSSNAISSAASKGAFNANMNDIDVGAAVTAFDITNELAMIAGVGCTTAVENVICVVAATSVADPNVTPTSLVLRSAVCATALVVTPVATDTVHSDPAASWLVAAVSVSVAVAVPEAVAATVNVVVPHPLDAAGVASVPIVNNGKRNAIASVLSRGAFNSNVYDNDDSDHIDESAIVTMLVLNAGAATAVDVVIAVAPMFVTDANVTAAVRVFRFAACVAAGVVTPVPTVT